MNELATWTIARRMEKTAKALEKNGFKVETPKGVEALRALSLEMAREAQTVGFGGSVGVSEAGLPKLMAEAGKTCLIHSLPGLSPEERLAVMRRQLTCDLFISGVNAVTLDGKVVNIDATGNRVSAMSFGPSKVLLVAGWNKISENLESAIARIKALAAPPNAKRLALETPCAKTGFCADCDSPQRICRIVHIMEKRPRMTDITIALVDENLGL